MVQIDFLRRVRHTETKPFGDSIRGKLNIEPRPIQARVDWRFKKNARKKGQGEEDDGDEWKRDFLMEPWMSLHGQSSTVQRRDGERMAR